MPKTSPSGNYRRRRKLTIADVIHILETATRQTSGSIPVVIEPEGLVYIAVSDTLAKEMVRALEAHLEKIGSIVQER